MYLPDRFSIRLKGIKPACSSFTGEVERRVWGCWGRMAMRWETTVLGHYPPTPVLQHNIIQLLLLIRPLQNFRHHKQSRAGVRTERKRRKKKTNKQKSLERSRVKDLASVPPVCQHIKVLARESTRGTFWPQQQLTPCKFLFC